MAENGAMLSQISNDAQLNVGTTEASIESIRGMEGLPSEHNTPISPDSAHEGASSLVMFTGDDVPYNNVEYDDTEVDDVMDFAVHSEGDDDENDGIDWEDDDDDENDVFAMFWDNGSEGNDIVNDNLENIAGRQSFRRLNPRSTYPNVIDGERVRTKGGSYLPRNMVGKPPLWDTGGQSVWVASAVLDGGAEIIPCKVAPHLGDSQCRVPRDGEVWFDDIFDVLIITDDMEWVPTNSGMIPHGRSPVIGGHERNGQKLYHAYAVVNNTRVPGKTAEHLGAAHVAYGDMEVVVRDDYWILCWRQEESI